MTATVTSDRVRGRGTALLRLLVRAGAVALGIGALWRSLFWVLAADRGLDLTDEGLYLLAARPPSIDAAWGTPAGWHTAPLFRMVGFDVAAFRTLGALLLVSAAGFLGREAVRLGQGVRKGANGTAERVERVLGAFLGGLGGLLYYGGLVRTPSYNWVTVLGATLAAVGLLQVVSARLPLSGAERTVPFLPWVGVGSLHLRGVLLAGFGAFFTIPAKPTTPVFFALLAIPILRLAGDLRFAVRTVLSVAATAAGFMTAAVLSGLWSPRFVAVFMRAIEAPVNLPEHRLSGALLAAPRFPFDLARDARVLTALAVLSTVVVLGAKTDFAERVRAVTGKPSSVVGVAIVALAILEGSRRGSRWLPNVDVLPDNSWINYVAAGAGSILLGICLGFLILLKHRYSGVVAIVIFMAFLSAPFVLVTNLLGQPATTQWVRPELLRDSVIVFVGMATLRTIQSTPIKEVTVSLHRVSWRHAVAPLSIMMFGIATGFGSGHGLVRQAALAGGLLTAALLLNAMTNLDCQFRTLAMILVAAFVLPTTGLQAVSNRQAPYRMEPISRQIVSASVGTDGASLYLDAELAEFLSSLTDAAKGAGWQRHTPVLAVASPWSTTVPWHLGARVPRSLMLTLRSLGVERLEYSLESVTSDEFSPAWIIITSDRQPLHDESLRFAILAADTIHHVFPDDFELVFRSASMKSQWAAQNGDIELWRPND